MAVKADSVLRDAARRLDVSTLTIKKWVTAGVLPAPGPWTDAQLRDAQQKAWRSAAPRRRLSSAHGTPSRWRAGCDCDECRDAHNAEVRSYRSTERRWAGDDAATILRLVGEGVHLSDALAEVGRAPQALVALRLADPAYARQLDDALMATRDPNLPHGTSTGWRKRCRCPECRTHHEATR